MGALDLSGRDAAASAASAGAVAPPPAPTDPLLAFAATAAPGAESVVEGQRVRISRAYVAASGKECRELMIGIGASERSDLVCRDEVTGWARVRPLLRGAGAVRP